MLAVPSTKQSSVYALSRKNCFWNYSFSSIFLGKSFILKNDHKPVYLFSRLAKLIDYYLQNDFVIEYIKSSSNVVVDALSRIQIPVAKLRDMSNKIAATLNVTTRSRSKPTENGRPTNSITDNKRTDHPGIAGLFKKAKNSIELRILYSDMFNKLLQVCKQFKWSNSCSSSHH